MRTGIQTGSLAFLLAFLQLPAAAAQRAPWHVRTTAAGALMVSTDQLGWLSYDNGGMLADVQLGYAVLPWLDVQVGAQLGMFMSEQENGGLAAPLLGALARVPGLELTPTFFVDLGAGFSGADLLPMMRAGFGLEVPIAASWSVGPTLAFTNAFYSNEPGASTDAAFFSLGVTLLYASVNTPHARPGRAVAAPTPAPPGPPRVVVVREPSTEILQLVDSAVPGRTDQIELLAPVLFAFDSDELEPVGVAMLHEVLRSLKERTDLALVEIRAHSDARGSADYNNALAQRRGERVYGWLVEHGIDPARLTIATVGAGEFVERGSDEAAHEQNRRVVFRVLKAGERR